MNDNDNRGNQNRRDDSGNRDSFNQRGPQREYPNQPYHDRATRTAGQGNEGGDERKEREVYLVDGKLPQELVSDNARWSARRGVEQYYLHAYKRRFGPESINGNVVRGAFDISFIIQSIVEMLGKKVEDAIYEDEPDEEPPHGA